MASVQTPAVKTNVSSNGQYSVRQTGKNIIVKIRKGNRQIDSFPYGGKAKSAVISNSTVWIALIDDARRDKRVRVVHKIEGLWKHGYLTPSFKAHCLKWQEQWINHLPPSLVVTSVNGESVTFTMQEVQWY